MTSELLETLLALSDALAGAGRYDDALAAANEAVELVEGPGGAPTNDVVRARLALGRRLTGVGRWADALGVRQAVLTRLPHGAGDEPADVERLATALIEVGQSLWQVRRPVEAIEHLDEGRHLARRLATTRPATYRPLLAYALRVAGPVLTDLGRSAEALSVLQEAAALHRQLALAHPDGFLPASGLALREAGVALGRAGRADEGLVMLQEARVIHAELYRKSPGSGSWDYAGTLRALADCRLQLGDPAAAQVAMAECIDLWRGLSDRDFFGYDGMLGADEVSLGRCLWRSGQLAEAITAMEAGVARLRRVAQEEDEGWVTDLLWALQSLSALLAAAHDVTGGVAVAEEAVAVAARGATPVPALESATRSLGRALAHDDARAREAAAAFERAAAMSRALHAADPDAHQLRLAGALNESYRHGREFRSFAENRERVAEAIDAARAAQTVAPETQAILSLLLFEHAALVWEEALSVPPGELPVTMGTADLEGALLALHEADQLDPGTSSRRMRAGLLQLLGRAGEAGVLRQAADRHESTAALLSAPVRRELPIRRLVALVDLSDPVDEQGAEALAVRAVTAAPDSAERQVSLFLLRRRARLEERRQGATESRSGPAAADLLADVTAFDATDARQSSRSRVEAATSLLQVDDPRGREILVQLAQDPGVRRPERERAAAALVTAGDARGRFLSVRPTGPAGGEPDGWDLALGPLPHLAALRGLSPAAAATLHRLTEADADRSPPGARARGFAVARMAAGQAGVFLLAFLAGEATARHRTAGTGPFRWAALALSTVALYQLFFPVFGRNTVMRPARILGLGPDAAQWVLGVCMLGWTVAIVAGFATGRSSPDLLAPVSTRLWDLLVWRRPWG